jgi:hypothetical protein
LNVAKPTVSVNVCRPTMRGPARTDPEQWWYIRFLRRFFDLRFDEIPEFLFYGDVGNGEHLLYPANVIRIFTTGENILPNWNEADYALTHERIYSERHWRLPLHRHWFDTTCTRPERDFSVISNRVSRFCNFIYSNDQAQKRTDFFNRLTRYKHVDAGGAVCNNMGGRVEDKKAFVAESKFTIAFENSSRSGYATEKVIEPLLNGSIPIYWGDPDIEMDFNPQCLVNVHRFNTFDEAVAEVKRIDQDDSLWRSYVTAPIFLDGDLPAPLTDEALAAFFAGIFSRRKRQIPALRRSAQRLRETSKRSRLFGALERQIGRFLQESRRLGRRSG